MRMRNKIYMKEWLSVRLVRYQSSRKLKLAKKENAERVRYEKKISI